MTHLPNLLLIYCRTVGEDFCRPRGLFFKFLSPLNFFIYSNGEEVENLKTELSDLYKKKATNDQQLIDANIKLIKLEKRLGAVTEE